MSRTEQWIKKAGFTPEQVRAMGLAPDQMAERARRACEVLRESEPEPGTVGRALLRHLEGGAA